MFVSVVIAVYNGEEYLTEAVNSILTQTYTDFELIVVNDGSTDRTGDILDCIYDRRVRIINFEKNMGAASALNAGIEQAKGDWIAVHDADDISLPNRLEEQVKFVNKNPGLVAAGTFIECIPGRRNFTSKRQLKEFELGRNSIRTCRDVEITLYNGCPLTHGSVIFSKKAFMKAGGYDPKLRIAYDYDLWTRLITLGGICNVPQKLYRYRRYQDSLSSVDRVLTSKELFYSFAKFLRATTFAKNKDKPAVIVFGSQKGAKSFSLQARKSLRVIKTFSRKEIKNLEETSGLYKRKRLNGVIILDNFIYKPTVMKYLRKKGMKINKDLFVFWSWI